MSNIVAASSSTYQDILNYWFGEDDPGLHYPKSRADLWFKNGKKYDAEISRKFSALHELASTGKLDHWLDKPLSRLSLVIILDQLSRHIYRETARAFAQDVTAQEIVLDGIQKQVDQQLSPAQRVFFYLPLEHAEDREIQSISVNKFKDLVAELPAEIQPEYASTLNFAVRHQDVIDQFGRFPDLNGILGRQSTAAEIDFLLKPGSSFL